MSRFLALEAIRRENNGRRGETFADQVWGTDDNNYNTPLQRTRAAVDQMTGDRRRVCLGSLSQCSFVASVLLFIVLELTGAPLHGQEKPFDEVVVHGATLKGQVVAIEPKGLRFETIYCEGSIFIPFNRLEAVRTEGSYTLQYGESEEASGRLWGIEDLHLLVGNDLASVERVPVDEIQSGAFAKEHKPSFAERLRARYPY